MIIGIDIDDTIADTCEVMFNYAQEYTSKVLKREPTIYEGSYKTHSYIQFMHNFTNEEDRDYVDRYYKKILIQTKPKTLAKKYLDLIKKEGNKIVIVTARYPSDKFDVEETTKKWLEKNKIPFDKLIINANDKLEIAKREKFDIFIDDSFKNCEMVSSIGIKTFLMDSRGNKCLNNENIERVYSWPHVYYKLHINKLP